jgi:hypothetical protein
MRRRNPLLDTLATGQHRAYERSANQPFEVTDALAKHGREVEVLADEMSKQKSGIG